VQLVVLAAVAVLVALPTASATSVNSPKAVPAASLLSANATWEGKNISQANTQGSAFSISANQQIYVNFSYVVPVGGPNVTVARIQAFYFGAVISTDQVSTVTRFVPGLAPDVAIGGRGSGVMNWSLGTFTYLLAGLYQLTASLVDSNGSTVWSENFFIDAKAVDRVASGLIIFLLVLGAVELWAIATVGRSVRKARPKRSGPPPPKQWEPTPAPGAGSEGTTPPPDAAPAEPASEVTP
jgi:hypothetical protein